MAEYIEREALIKYIEEDLALCDNALSENAPITYVCKLGLRAAMGAMLPMKPSDFCSYGERKECADNGEA